MTTLTLSVPEKILEQYSPKELQEQFENFLFEQELRKEVQECKEAPESDFIDL